MLPLGAFPDMNQTVLKDPDANQLIAAAETLPFMADRRMVVVSESGMLTGKARDYDEAASAERLKTYLPELPDTTALVFYVRGAADKRKKLYQTIKKCGCVVSFDRLDFWQMKDLTFSQPDTDTFKGLKFAYEAGAMGGSMPCVFNAANEIAVGAFLRDEIKFLDIYDIIEETMLKRECIVEPTLEELFEEDRWAREFATEVLRKL